MSELRKIRRALISVSDKSGLNKFAVALAGFGVEIISTGGTATSLRKHGLAVTDVSDVTGFPEMMDGRVKTLHPKIHGAFLALRDNAEHIASLNEHEIAPIDLVVVNLYPFEHAVRQEGVAMDQVIENIDIGGPAMIRSAAKNWKDVAVVIAPQLYDMIIDEMEAHGGCLCLNTRQRLAALSYSRTANYDLAISNYLSAALEDRGVDLLHLVPFGGTDSRGTSGEQPEGRTSTMPSQWLLQANKIADLRYGENPHQQAALYSTQYDYPLRGIAGARQLHGKEMSYNNYLDADAAWNLVQDFDEIAVAIIKHTNPSGVGVGESSNLAYRRALSTDPVSAFGGIVAFNHTVDRESALSISEIFTEAVVAPDYSSEAISVLKRKKNLRVLAVSPLVEDAEYRTVSGGLLVQEKDVHILTGNDLTIVTKRQPSAVEISAMLFAWHVCKHVKSNAIVFANEHQTLGVGAGQMNRVDSVRIAAIRAERFKLPLQGAAMASDAFFPFRDSVDEAATLGISAIIQPGGSIKDDESIAAANEHGIVMAITSVRHFKH